METTIENKPTARDTNCAIFVRRSSDIFLEMTS